MNCLHWNSSNQLLLQVIGIFGSRIEPEEIVKDFEFSEIPVVNLYNEEKNILKYQGDFRLYCSVEILISLN